MLINSFKSNFIKFSKLYSQKIMLHEKIIIETFYKFFSSMQYKRVYTYFFFK